MLELQKTMIWQTISNGISLPVEDCKKIMLNMFQRFEEDTLEIDNLTPQFKKTFDFYLNVKTSYLDCIDNSETLDEH